MNTSVAKSGKKVAKKTESAVVAAPVAAAAPAAPAKAKKAAAAAPAAVAAPVVAAPEAQAVAAVASVSTVAEDLQGLISNLTAARDTIVKAIHTAKALEKKNARELRQASRRRRSKRSETTEGGEVREKRPSIFTIPFTLKDSLCTFLGKAKGTQMSPAEVTRAVKVYIDTHKLKGEKHKILPDAAMCNVLGVQAGEELTYRNIQKYLYKLYDLKSASKTA
jgi:hypothetical protein